MTVFDRKRLMILFFIHRRGKIGATWDEIRSRFDKDDANILFLESLSIEGYTITQDESGKWMRFKEGDIHRDQKFRSYCTPKGNELIERRLFDFWKFVIPLLVSVLALIVSAVS